MAKKSATGALKAAATKLKKAAAPRKAPAAKLSVVIDYPREGDLVRPGHYAIRVDAVGADQLQLRLDGTDWIDCREAVGFFWYDWAPQKPGAVVLSARARKGKGRWVASAERRCVVEA